MDTLESEIFRLIQQLMLKMGIDGYCHWLANETPAAWVLDAPYAEIADGMRGKLEVTP